MPRWPEWFRKVGETATHPAALDVGRKLLGYLATRRETPGVQTLVKRVTLDDGTTVEASFTGDQPQVIVYAPDGQETCELYVESGMLDLGPNIAADAGERFNRGPPEFDDRPATLYFGDGVDCRQGEPGLNGKVRVNVGTKTLKSECLPKNGRSVESRLRDPVKKKAQALLPASCWSGLMQRYVQAVYGSTALDYSASTTALVIAGASIPATASIGLIAIDGELRFVVFDADSGALDVRACVPSGPCFSACLELWRSLPERDDADIARKRKVLSIALSGCKIGKSLETVSTGVSGNAFFPNRPAMHFADDGKSAAVVLESGGTATAYRVTFGISAGRVTASASSVGAGRVITDPNAWPMRVAGAASAFAGNVISEPGFQDGDALSDGSNFDYPVYAICTPDGIDVVRYSLLISEDVVVEADACAEEDRRPTNFGPDPPCSSTVRSFKNVVSGYYCTGDAGVRWSVVEQTPLAKNEDGLNTKIAPSINKALSITPIGEERQDTYPISELLMPEAVWMMGTGTIRPPADGDCLFVSGVVPQRILHGINIFSAPPASCDVIRDYVWGSCVGPVSGTGFPPYISEGTCDFRYSFGVRGVTKTCSNVVRSQDAKVYALWVSGVLYSPRPHAISMCSGSYDFVVDRHALTAFDGTYASKADTWNDFENRYVCDFSGALSKITANEPGGLCNNGGATVTFHADLSGRYEYPFQGHELLRRTTFNDWLNEYEKNRLAKRLRRGNENYKSASSYGEEVSLDGSFSFNTSDGAPESYSAEGEQDVIKACSFTERLFIGDVADDPIETETASSKGDTVRWESRAPDTAEVMLGGFTYACASSLLGAAITHTLQLDRGYSINMDRQTITGGYPKVSTPSFVGWA